MTVIHIAVFAIGAFLFGFVIPGKWRSWALLLASVLAIYWLQPALPISPIDFALPTATIALGIIGWLLVREESAISSENIVTLSVVLVVVLALAVIGPRLRLVPSAPNLIDLIVVLAALAAAIVTLGCLAKDRLHAIPAAILLVILIFVMLKSEPLAQSLSLWLRAQTGRPLVFAQAADIQWLGFSYVAFRLLHTLRDRQTGRLPALSLREYLTYLIFFTAYTAGPIDRAERFVKDYRAIPQDGPSPLLSLVAEARQSINRLLRRTPEPALETVTTTTAPNGTGWRSLAALNAPRTVEGMSRIVIGLTKKFIIADGLALFALDAARASQAQTTGGMWVLLYAYAFRIYFDFSGYSDIAIGLGRLFSINLPENFDRPYLKDNITQFWNSWHITLSTWARFYVFTPLSRVLMNRPNKPSAAMVVLVGQVATMVVIGLWHGISLNFVLWGLWHGIGLWIHKLFADRSRTFYQGLNEKPGLRRAASWAGILITFHYVALGWVFFSLPDTALSLYVLKRLFGG